MARSELALAHSADEAYFPALTTESDPDLPGIELAALQQYDEQLTALIQTAAQKGFSQRLIDSIKGTRIRMYGERADVWRKCTVFGLPSAALEAPADDQETDDVLIRAAREETAASLDAQLGIRKNDEEGRYEVTGDMPHFNTWLRANGLGYSRHTNFVRDIEGQYGGWLLQQKERLINEVDQQLRQGPLAEEEGGSQQTVQGLVSELYNNIFVSFNDLFQTHIDAGNAKLADMEDRPEARPEARSAWRKVLRREVTSKIPTNMPDSFARERKELSGFFEIDQAMTRCVQALQESAEITSIINKFKRVTGLDLLENAAEVFMSQHITQERAEDFLAQFEGAIDAYFQKQTGSTSTRRRHRSSDPVDTSAPEEPAATEAPKEAKQEPLVILPGYTRTSISFDKRALADKDWSGMLLEGFQAALNKHKVKAEVLPEVAKTLFEEALASGETDAEGLEAKKVFRRTFARFYYEHQETEPLADPQAEAERQYREQAATSAGALFNLYRDGLITVKKQDERVKFIVREQPR